MKRLSGFICIALVCLACGGKSETSGSGGLDNLDQKGLQYYSNGKKLYGTYCQNCHMEEGAGLGRLIPPLKGADYLLEDLSRAARIIKYGQKGPITVNQVEFNQPMPANPKLTNLEIAEIVTYISNAWENQGKRMSIEEVEAALKEPVDN